MNAGPATTWRIGIVAGRRRSIDRSRRFLGSATFRCGNNLQHVCRRRTLDGIGLLKPKNASWWISPDGLIAEAEDILARVQGKERVVSFCLRALRSEVEKLLNVLREAYALIPAYMREPCLGRANIRFRLALPR